MRGGQPAAAASRGTGLGVVPKPGERVAKARQQRRNPPDPGAVLLTERIRDPRPERPSSPLPASCSEPREEELLIQPAFGAKRRDDVEAVPLVGDVHRVEEGELGGRQPAGQRLAFVARHPGAPVRAELADLRAPEGRERHC